MALTGAVLRRPGPPALAATSARARRPAVLQSARGTRHGRCSGGTSFHNPTRRRALIATRSPAVTTIASLSTLYGFNAARPVDTVSNRRLSDSWSNFVLGSMCAAAFQRACPHVFACLGCRRRAACFALKGCRPVGSRRRRRAAPPQHYRLGLDLPQSELMVERHGRRRHSQRQHLLRCLRQLDQQPSQWRRPWQLDDRRPGILQLIYRALY